MNADEARQYAKELQHENKEERVLSPFNKWFIRRCIRKIDKEIKKEVKRGRDYYMVVFTVNAPHAIQDKDKLFLADYYKSQGYHVELCYGSMYLSWAVVSPWGFSENDTILEGN